MDKVLDRLKAIHESRAVVDDYKFDGDSSDDYGCDELYDDYDDYDED